VLRDGGFSLSKHDGVNADGVGRSFDGGGGGGGWRGVQSHRVDVTGTSSGYGQTGARSDSCLTFAQATGLKFAPLPPPVHAFGEPCVACVRLCVAVCDCV
jgi:hypothetical protein